MLTANNKTRKIKNAIMTMAAVLAIGGALAFKTDHIAKKSGSYYVWFQVNPDGTAVDPSNGQAGDNPFGCEGSGPLCSRALLYDPDNSTLSQTEYNASTSTYSIKSGVDITNDYQDQIRKATSFQ